MGRGRHEHVVATAYGRGDPWTYCRPSGSSVQVVRELADREACVLALQLERRRCPGPADGRRAGAQADKQRSACRRAGGGGGAAWRCDAGVLGLSDPRRLRRDLSRLVGRQLRRQGRDPPLRRHRRRRSRPRCDLVQSQRHLVRSLCNPFTAHSDSAQRQRPSSFLASSSASSFLSASRLLQASSGGHVCHVTRLGIWGIPTLP